LIGSANRGFPYRWVLPIAQLAVCVVLLWPLRHFYAWQLQASIHAYRLPGASVPLPELKSPVRIDSLPMNPRESAAVRLEEREISAAVLNLPAGILQLPYVILNPKKTEWLPRGVYFFQAWRAVSWPIICIPFWWLAGLGMEALMASRRNLLQPRIGWVDTCVAALVFASGILITVCVLCVSSLQADWRLVVFGTGGALWAVLSGLTIAARVAQWRIRRRSMRAVDGAPVTQPTA
jgi:hypothetical protein